MLSYVNRREGLDHGPFDSGRDLVPISAQCMLQYYDLKLGLYPFSSIGGKVWMSPPCESWSTARRGRRGPGKPKGFPAPVRSHQQLWGLSNLIEADKRLCENGNGTARMCLKVLEWCNQHRIPAALENPMSSLIFLLPELKKLFQEHGQTHEVIVDMCSFGTEYLKPTRVWMFNVKQPKLSVFCRCRFVRQGGVRVCSFSGRPHTQLSGVNKSASAKAFMTKEAQMYPEGFAQLFVQLLMA